MAKKYIKVYYDWIEATEMLSSVEKGRLIDAMVLYASGHEEEAQLAGAERFLFPIFRSQIDRDDISYQTKIENGKKGGLAKVSETKRNLAKSSEIKQDKEKDKDKEEEKDKEKSIKKKAALSHTPDLSSFSPLMQEAISRWLKYKAERKEKYAPTGLESMLSRIRNEIAKNSEEQVKAVIELSMANNWKGIIWDRMPPKAETKRESSFDIDELDMIIRSM
jgi:hypothetical protein